jgi:hypothetical protein
MPSANKTGRTRNTTRKWCGPFGCFSRSSKGTANATAAANAAAATAAAAAAAERAAAERAERAARAAAERAARAAAERAAINAELAELMAAAAGPGAAVQGARDPPIDEQLRLLEAEVEANAAAEGQDNALGPEYYALQRNLQEQANQINELGARLAQRRGGNRKKSSKLRKTRSKKSRRHRR